VSEKLTVGQLCLPHVTSPETTITKKKTKNVHTTKNEKDIPNICRTFLYFEGSILFCPTLPWHSVREFGLGAVTKPYITPTKCYAA